MWPPFMGKNLIHGIISLQFLQVIYKFTTTILFPVLSSIRLAQLFSITP